MNKSLTKLLADVSTDDEDDDNFTHVTKYPREKKWCIKHHEKSTFWQNYCDLVSNSEEGLCLAEKNIDIVPFIVEFTFKFYEDTNNNDAIKDEFVLKLILCCQQVLIDLFEINDEEKELYCLVLETDSNYVDMVNDCRILCRPVRLQFPFCKIEAKIASQLIYPSLIKIFKQQNIVGMLDQQPMNDWENIIDMTLLEKPILLYGSVNNPGEPVKKVSYVFHKITQDHIDGYEDFESLDLDTVMEFDDHQDVISKLIHIDDMDEYDFDHWLPMLLSIYYYSGITKLKNIPKSKSKVTVLLNKNCDDTPIGLANRFLGLLDKSRFTEKIYVMEIGRALYHSYEGSSDGCEVWKQHSKVYIDNYEDTYSSFYDSHITIKTLAWYAKEDSPKNYRDWHDSYVKKFLEDSLDLVDNNIAKALYKCYWLDYSFVPTGRSGMWYRFMNHRWYKNDKGIEIKKLISADFVTRYENLLAEYIKEKAKAPDDFTKGKIQNKMEQVMKLTKKLGKYTYKSTIEKNVQEFFCDENFIVILNQNCDCIGHRNCVSETCDDKILFRNGKPEDYISRSTGVNIDKTMTWNHPNVKKVLTWFRQVFVDEELRDTFFKYGSTWFIGGNPDKFVPCWSGVGDNSKSMVVKAFELAFGEYCFKIPTSVFTSSQKGNGPTPELNQARGTRGGFSDELEEEEMLKTGFLKRISGGDSFFARGCNEDGGKVKMTFKLILVCNKIPRMNSVHQSVKNRFLIFPFLSRWSYDAPTDEEAQYKEMHFKRDNLFERQIPALAPALLWVFAQYYPKYVEEGLKIPKIVKMHTDEYWKEVDMYSLFRQEYVGIAYKPELDKNGKKVQDDKAKVNASDLYKEFKLWFRLNYEGERPPTSRDFKTELIKVYGKLHLDKWWYGIYITTQQCVDEKVVE